MTSWKETRSMERNIKETQETLFVLQVLTSFNMDLQEFSRNVPSKSGNSQMYHSGVYRQIAIRIQKNQKMNERDDQPVELEPWEYPLVN